MIKIKINHNNKRELYNTLANLIEDIDLTNS